MIKIVNENFCKQVKNALRKASRNTKDVYVHYTIDNVAQNGTLSIKIYDGIDVMAEVYTEIEFDLRLISFAMGNSRPIKRIVFNVYPTDMVLDIITHNHHFNAWHNAYDWHMQIVEKGKKKDTMYHMSHIHFYNEKRTKSTCIKQICFNGCEMIYTEDK